MAAAAAPAIAGPVAAITAVGPVFVNVKSLANAEDVVKMVASGAFPGAVWQIRVVAVERIDRALDIRDALVPLRDPLPPLRTRGWRVYDIAHLINLINIISVLNRATPRINRLVRDPYDVGAYHDLNQQANDLRWYADQLPSTASAVLLPVCTKMQIVAKKGRKDAAKEKMQIVAKKGRKDAAKEKAKGKMRQRVLRLRHHLNDLKKTPVRLRDDMPTPPPPAAPLQQQAFIDPPPQQQ
ncbi:hypothetical protein ACP4OV_014020 [Aristida adscensionis]